MATFRLFCQLAAKLRTWRFSVKVRGFSPSPPGPPTLPPAPRAGPPPALCPPTLPGTPSGLQWPPVPSPAAGPRTRVYMGAVYCFTPEQCGSSADGSSVGAVYRFGSAKTSAGAAWEQCGSSVTNDAKIHDICHYREQRGG